jgi:hypothetical protein
LSGGTATSHRGGQEKGQWVAGGAGGGSLLVTEEEGRLKSTAREEDREEEDDVGSCGTPIMQWVTQ